MAHAPHSQHQTQHAAEPAPAAATSSTTTVNVSGDVNTVQVNAEQIHALAAKLDKCRMLVAAKLDADELAMLQAAVTELEGMAPAPAAPSAA